MAREENEPLRVEEVMQRLIISVVIRFLLFDLRSKDGVWLTQNSANQMPIADWIVVKLAVKLRENSHPDRDQPLFKRPDNQSFLLSGSSIRKCNRFWS